MASEIKVDTIVNAGGDNDTGIDLATNDQILLKVANATKLTMNSTGQTTIVGEGGTTTTSVQQGLTKVFCKFNGESTIAIGDSFNTSGIDDNGTGQYDVNYTNSMASANNCPNINADQFMSQFDAEPNATRVNMTIRNSSNSTVDTGFISVNVNGDLA
jgi:hypothetical protein